MTDSKAHYSALASDEKPPHPPAYAPSSLDAEAPLPSAQGGAPRAVQPERRRRRRAVLLGFLAILTGAVLVATGLGVGAMNGLCGGRAPAQAQAGWGQAEERGGRFKREVTTIPGHEAASAGHPKFSTSTYANGEVSSFVYTTRPIVNPGGYTFGTLTGYVHITSTPSPSASASETYPTSPQSRFKREASTIPHEFLQPSTSTEVVYKTVTAAPTATSTTIVWASAVDPARVRVRRNSEVRPAGRVGEGEVAEFRTSVNRKGETVVLIKTTRPIVNPAGQTIGTLDGVYVRPAATPTVAPVGLHTELKRRAEEAADDLG